MMYSIPIGVTSVHLKMYARSRREWRTDIDNKNINAIKKIGSSALT